MDLSLAVAVGAGAGGGSYLAVLKPWIRLPVVRWLRLVVSEEDGKTGHMATAITKLSLISRADPSRQVLVR